MSTPRKRMAVLVFVEVDAAASTDKQVEQLRLDVEGMLADAAGVSAAEVAVEPNPAGPASTLHTPDVDSAPDPAISQAIEGLGSKLLERAQHYARIAVEAGKSVKEAAADAADFGADATDAIAADGLGLLREAVGELTGLWRKYGLTNPEVVKEAIKYVIKLEIFDTIAQIFKSAMH